MALTDSKRQRIAEMLLKGFSLNLISEWGVNGGWTRQDVEGVIKVKGWALDWEGRLQGRYRGDQAIKAVAYRASMADAQIEYMISVGMDHPEVEIRRFAVKAQRAADELRRALLIQEEKDAEEVARRRRVRDAEQANPRWPETDLRPYMEAERVAVKELIGLIDYQFMIEDRWSSLW